MQHAIRGRADEHVRGRFFPRQPRRLGHALVVLHLGVLREAAPVRFVAPDPLRRREHRIFAGDDMRIVGLPHAAVHDDVVADLHVRDVLADGPHHAARVAAADVKVLELAFLLPRLDDVDGDPHRRPHVVVVDARGHHVDEHVAWTERRYRQRLLLERVARLAEPLGADHLREHLVGQDAEIGHVSEGANIVRRVGMRS